MRRIVLMMGVLGLSACMGTGKDGFSFGTKDQPFDEGTVYVVATERGELRTYALRPCRNETHICGTRAGHLSETEQFYAVTGAYPGRTFFLSPGGDGVLRRGSHEVPLAWNEGEAH